MSQGNSVKALRNKHAKCLVENKGKTPLIDIKGSSYDRPRTTNYTYNKTKLCKYLFYLLSKRL